MPHNPAHHPLYEAQAGEMQSVLAASRVFSQVHLQSLYDYVRGPASATDGYVPVFDGASGRIIRVPLNSDIVLGSGAAIIVVKPGVASMTDLGDQTLPHRTLCVQGTTSKAALQVMPQAAPSSPVDGDVWHDSTRDTLQAFVSGVKHTLGGVLYQSTASVTHANSTTETSLVGSGVGTMTLPSAALIAGKKLRFHASGTITTDAVAPGTLTLTLYHNTSVSTIAVTNTPPLLGSGTKRKWVFDLELVIRGSTTCIGQGKLFISTSLTDGVWWEFGTSNSTAAIAGGLIDFKADWQTADVDNEIICTDFSMELLG